MPDAKSVEGSAAPRPVVRKRIVRKPVEPAAPTAVPAPSPAAPTTAPASPAPAVAVATPTPATLSATPAAISAPATAPLPAPPALPAPLPPAQPPIPASGSLTRESSPPVHEGPPPPRPRERDFAPPPRDFSPPPRDFGGPHHGPGPRFRDRSDRGDRGDRGDRFPDRGGGFGPDIYEPPIDTTPRPGRQIHRLDDLYRMPMQELFKLAEKEGIREHTGMNRAQLIVGIVRRQIERGELVHGSGTLEVLPDGYGFLRSAAHNYLASPEDIYVSPSQIRRMSLRTGYIVEGPIRLPIENQDNFALMQIALVNGKSAEEMASVTNFEDLTPLHPQKRLRLETTPDEISMRIMDLITPIGKGQRGLIVAPPRTGKTILLSKLANAILKNHPEAYVFVLLIDERPEEVTEMQRLVQSPNAEVVASTFDEPPEEHIHVAEIVLEKAKRMVESRRDVIILLDSITRLARAHNTEAGPGGKLLSGGLDSNAMQKPKRFFGAARNVEEGGSLTILATALIDTNSKMDEVIFEEFKGTGNMELHLDRRLVEKRVYPAIDVNSSGTRKEDLLLTPEELQKISLLRRVLADMHPVEAMELLVNRAKKSKSNADFLISMNLS